MSDLQIVLMIIGGVIIVAVLVFNWWQERRFHQQLAANFSDIKNDALLEHSVPDEALSADAALQATSTGSTEIDFDHDDFSIDHESIKEISNIKEEPHIAIADGFIENASGAEPEVQAEQVADSENVATVSLSADSAGASGFANTSDFASTSDFVSAPPEFDNPFASEKPANHEGIRAIFEGVFNKAEHSDSMGSTQSEQASYVNAPETGMSADASAAESVATLPDMLHAQVDLIASLHLTADLTVDAAVTALTNVFDAFDKPTFVHVLTSDMHWLVLSDAASNPEFSNKKVSKITCSLQLADRTGPVSRGMINRFQLAVETLGMDINAHVEWLNGGDAVADAVALDAFCIDVDKTMGFHLVHGESGAFTGTKLRGLAEAQGLELTSEGTFKYFDEAAGKPSANGTNPPVASFVMFNRDHYPFNPDMLRSSVVKAITFQLDIPHVKNSIEAFNHMVQVAKQMETGLHAQLVDDNNKPLTDAQIEKIRHQLKVIQATMLSRGIAPGSDCAQRLFS